MHGKVNQKENKIFDPGLVLIGLSEPGPGFHVADSGFQVLDSGSIVCGT